MGARKMHIIDPATVKFGYGLWSSTALATSTCCGELIRRGLRAKHNPNDSSCTRCQDRYPPEMYEAGEALNVIGRWFNWMHTLWTWTCCRVCGGAVNDELFRYAVKKIEQQVCSSDCITMEVKRQYACCEKAELSPCVCRYSFNCTIHGDTHIGTHD